MTRTNLAKAPHIRAMEQEETRRNLEAEKNAREDAEERAVRTGMAETISLDRARGAKIITPKSGRGEGDKPAKRVQSDGLDHLKHKLTGDQLNTGRKFEAFWRATHRSDTKSCLNIMEGGKGHAYNASEAYSYAQFKLGRAQDILGGHNGMWTALVQICGEGKRPAEVNSDRRQYEKLEAQLDCALSLLVRHWGV